MFSKLLYIALLFVSSYFFCSEEANAQHTAPVKKSKSNNQLQSEFYSRFTFKKEEQWDSLHFKLTGKPVKIMERREAKAASCTLKKRVFGWFPYWTGNVYQNFQWDKLSDLCYFDYTVDYHNGNNVNPSYNFKGSAAVTAAINNGVKVHICAALFDHHASFFSNSTAQNNLITKLITDLKAKNGKGINIDFEAMYSSSLKTGFTNFIKNLAGKLHAQVSGSELSVAVQWESNGAIDFTALKDYVDLWIHMGYDYSTGLTVAGPTDPLNKFPNIDLYLTSTVNSYLNSYHISASKFMLALPYYGVGWGVDDACALGTDVNSDMYTYDISDVVKNTDGHFTSSNRHTDNTSKTDYYCFTGSDPDGPNEFFIDGTSGMSARFDLINTKKIAGLGIWALGKDDGTTAYWNLIASKFATCGTTCADNYEPNNSKSAAYKVFSTPLGQSSTSKTINSYIFSGTDQDWYKIDLAAKGTLTIKMSSLPKDYDIKLYSSNGTTTLKSSAHSGTTNDTVKYSYTSSSSTSVYLKVYPKSSSQYSQCDDYALNIGWAASSTSSSCNDIFEPNNSVASATKVFGNPLNSGSSDYTMHANIGAADDDDWYKVDVGACGRLTVNLTDLPYNYDVEFYKSNGTSFMAGGYHTGTSNEQVSHSYTGSDVTYVKVYAANFSDHTTASCYNIEFLWEPCPAIAAQKVTAEPAVVTKLGSPTTPVLENITSKDAETGTQQTVTGALAGNGKGSELAGVNVASVKLAPNPARSTLNVYTTGLEQKQKIFLSVMSASGVILKTMEASGYSRTINLDVSSLGSGMYMVKIASGNKVMYRQFVKL